MADVPKASLDDTLRRVEELESQVRALKKGLEEVKDIQLVEKMDILNLKNEIESIEMASPQFSKAKEESRSILELTEELEEMKEQLSGGRLNVCGHCGSVVPRGVNYCGRCGSKL